MSPPAPDWKSFSRWCVENCVARDDHSLCLDGNLGTVRLSAVGDGAFRLRFAGPELPDYGILQGACAPLPCNRTIGMESATLATGEVTLKIRFGDETTFELSRDGTVITRSSTDAHFTGVRRIPAFGRDSNGWICSLELADGEPIYGLGERWGALSARGQLVEGWNRDALGVNTAAAYKHVPFAFSPRGWGVFVHTPARILHGVGYAPWSHRTLGVRVEDAILDVFILCGATPAELIERYTVLTGRMPMVPRWSLGVWMSRAYYRDSAEVLAAAREIRARGMPCDVITLDGRCWLDTDTRFAFEWDQSRHPDPRALTDELHRMGFKVCAWEYPLISSAHSLHAEYARNGWLLRTAENGEALVHRWDPEPFGEVLTPLPDSGIVDFTHPDAFDDWRDRHAALFADGIDVIKSDFGEQVPEDCVAANGERGARLHNVYSLLYNRCVYEATLRATQDTGAAVVFARSGWAGSQRYPVQWGGDPQADWGGLAASIRGALSWGLSGGACYAHDIGGFYADRRDPELYVRWLQAAIFGSHCRMHGVGAREPWSYGDDVARIAADWLALRYRLIPYLESAIEEASCNGMPVMRAMVLTFPAEELAWHFDTQFMCGRDLLIMPVLQPGGAVRGYLPAGKWHDFWAGEVVAGGRAVRQLVPLERIPVYVRDGADLPLGPPVDCTGKLNAANRIEEVRAFRA